MNPRRFSRPKVAPQGLRQIRPRPSQLPRKLQYLWDGTARYWQTWVLLSATVAGYSILLASTEFRPIAWLLGGGVAIAMIFTWFKPFWPTALAATEEIPEEMPEETWEDPPADPLNDPENF
jgi:hypothetical protein